MADVSVTDLYQSAVSEGEIQPSEDQIIVVNALDQLRTTLVQRARYAKWSTLFRYFTGKPRSLPTGLYLYGGVGTGKTLLMDMFVESLPFAGKVRMHFYRFMQRVHQELRQYTGRSDPLVVVAKQWADQASVICLDEFLVQDIADAMLLGELLEHLFRHQVCLVTTSNTPIDNLYENGLQRGRFLPAIEKLKQYTRSLLLESETDYRLRSLDKARTYYQPLGSRTDEKMMQSWRMLAPSAHRENEWVEVNGRLINSLFATDTSVWFDFEKLCGDGRSQLDYIELARCYHAVFLSNVPQMTEALNDKVRRFISLVDEFYDRKVKLMLSAAVPLESLYTGSRLASEFERTHSRLVEMQSQAFLAAPHLS